MNRSVLAVGALILAGCSGLKPLPREDRRIVAVMPFSYSAPAKEFAAITDGISDGVAGALVRTGRVRMVERQRVQSLLAGLQYEVSGAVDSALAAKIGKQLGADAVVLGAVTNVSVRDEGRDVVIAKKKTQYVEVAAEARIVDIETGELLASGRAVGKAKASEKVAFGAALGQLAAPDALVQSASRDLAETLARQMGGMMPPKGGAK